MIEHELRLLRSSLRQHPGLNLMMVLSVALGVAAFVIGRGATSSQLREPLPGHPALRHVALPHAALSPERAEHQRISELFRYAASLVAYRDAVVVQAPDGQWRGIATFAGRTTLRAGSHAERPDVRFCTPAFFEAFDFELEHGRTWTEAEERSAAPVVVLDASLSRELFGRTDAVGQAVELAGRSLRVVGIVRESSAPYVYDFPRTDVVAHERVFAPFSLAPALGVRPRAAVAVAQHDDTPRALYASDDVFVQLWIELRDPSAASAFERHLHTYAEQQRALGRPLEGELASTTLDFVRAHHNLASGYGILELLAYFVLGVGLLGFARLLMAKSLTQHARFGMHRAFGATRTRVFARLLGEAAALATLGALLGLVLATLGLRAVGAVITQRLAEMSIDGELVALGVLAALLTGVLAGCYPAWRIARSTPSTLLRRA